MTRRLAALCVALAACGRIGFASLDRDPHDDAREDAAPCAMPLCLDTTFADAGTLQIDVGGVNNASYGYRALAVQPDDKLVISGRAGTAADRDMLFVRLLDDGGRDPSFGSGGVSVIDTQSVDDEANAIALDASGNIYAAGAAAGTAVVIRVTPDGAHDGWGGGSGIATPAIGSGGHGAAFNNIAIDAAGRVVAGGQVVDPSTGFDVLTARFEAAGPRDTSFGGTGAISTDIHGRDDFAALGEIASDGTLYTSMQTNNVGTAFDGAILRMLPSGARDPAFGSGGVAETDFGHGADRYVAMTLDAEERPIAVGLVASVGTGDANKDFVIARYTRAGALDATFGSGGSTILDRSATDIARSAAVLADGRIVVGGEVSTTGGSTAVLMVLDASGVLASFETIALGSAVNCVRIDRHGRVLALGTVVTGDGTTDIFVRRYRVP